MRRLLFEEDLRQSEQQSRLGEFRLREAQRAEDEAAARRADLLGRIESGQYGEASPIVPTIAAMKTPTTEPTVERRETATEVLPFKDLVEPIGTLERGFMHEAEGPAAPPMEEAPAAAPAISGPEASTTDEAGPTYTMRRGDSLFKVARDQLGDARRWREIARINGIAPKDFTRLPAGTVLQMPPGAATPSAPAASIAPATPALSTPGRIREGRPEPMGPGGTAGPAAPPPTTRPEPAEPGQPEVRLYTIERGDSLRKIAREELGDESRYREVATLNGIAPRDYGRLRIGQEIRLPGAPPAPAVVPTIAASVKTPEETRRAEIIAAIGEPGAAAPETPPSLMSFKDATDAAAESASYANEEEAPAAPAGPPETPQAEYVVAANDTLSKIARDRLGDIRRWREIALINGLKPPYTIQPGQKLNLPAEAAVHKPGKAKTVAPQSRASEAAPESGKGGAGGAASAMAGTPRAATIVPSGIEARRTFGAPPTQIVDAATGVARPLTDAERLSIVNGWRERRAAVRATVDRALAARAPESLLMAISDVEGAAALGERAQIMSEDDKRSFATWRAVLEEAHTRAEREGAAALGYTEARAAAAGGRDQILSVDEAARFGVPYGTTRAQVAGTAVPAAARPDSAGNVAATRHDESDAADEMAWEMSRSVDRGEATEDAVRGQLDQLVTDGKITQHMAAIVDRSFSEMRSRRQIAANRAAGPRRGRGGSPGATAQTPKVLSFSQRRDVEHEASMLEKDLEKLVKEAANQVKTIGDVTHPMDEAARTQAIRTRDNDNAKIAKIRERLQYLQGLLK